MIDLHCHILPGVDDGPKTLEDAIEMAKVAMEDGITDIVATPHTKDGVYLNSAEDVQQTVTLLQNALNDNGIPITIHVGTEVHIHLEMIDNLTSREVLTYCNGMKYVLLELPVMNIPRFTEDLLYELQVEGITPIIAHPERNIVLRDDPNYLIRWIEQGVIAQLTAGSLLGQMGERAKSAAENMVRNRVVHVIASDGHDAIRRRPELSAAYEQLKRITSAEEANMFHDNSQLILLGESCQVLDPILQTEKKKRFFFF